MVPKYILVSKTQVCQKENKIPIEGHFDIIVAGAGVAGVSAAVSAARFGAKTLLVDRNGYPGGVTTGGLSGVIWGPSDAYSGLCKNIFQRLLEIGGAQEGKIVPFDPEAMKHVLFKIIEEQNVQFLPYTMVVDSIKESDHIRGIIVENKAGRQAFLAKTVIDTSGDGDIAAFAGVPFQKGRRDGKMRPMTLIFRVGNIDLDKLVEYAKTHPDQFTNDQNVNIIDPENQYLRLSGFFDLVSQSRQLGELDADVYYLRVESVWFRKRIASINTTRIYNVDGTNPWDLSKAQINLMKQVRKVEFFLKARVPGFSDSFIIDTAPMIGVRETRHIIGDHVLQLEEIINDKFFRDAIYRHTAHMVKGQPTHDPDGKEGSEADIAYRVAKWPRHSHSVPYGSLVPKDVRNLLIAGRCISATHQADEWTRQVPVCFGTGQAAGTAAALSIKNDEPLDTLAIEKIQEELVRQGVQIR
jgi:hypothetical protein